MSSNKVTKLKPAQKPAAALDTPTDLDDAAVKAVSEALNGLLADSYALYLKTKNFHWHVSGPHFRDYHLLFDEQADRHPRRHRRHGRAGPQDRRHHAALDRPHRQAPDAIEDNDDDFVPPAMMLQELMNDNKKVAEAMRKAHEVCDEHEDIATASLIEVWIDQTEKRTWFLFEAARGASNSRPLKPSGVNVRGARHSPVGRALLWCPAAGVFSGSP